MTQLRHSIFSRIVGWAIAIAAGITFVLWLLTDTTIERSHRLALERAVDVDLAGMVDIYASGGMEELRERIEDRLALQTRDGNQPHYLVATSSGRPLAGDLRRWPNLHASLSEAGPVRVDGDRRAFARATQLGPDLRLLVAHEYNDLSAMRSQVALVFLAGGALAVIAVALVGWMATRRLAARIERINAAFRQGGGEALERLLSHPEGRDEIDELASHSGNALTRLGRLATAQRETTDHVAHEIRTPLMHLDNRLVKALAATPEPETAARIADARSEIRSITRMLESLLDIAASEARRGDRHGLLPVDLSALATRLGELYADSAEESGHHLQLDIEPGVTVQGEEMALTRLITNLLDNAFKFVPAGGTIRLRLSRGPRLVISDDGPGIPVEMRETIFEKFGRGSDRTGEVGAGLGLALCRAIAERHHLQMTLVPTERGACFTVAPETRR